MQIRPPTAHGRRQRQIVLTAGKKVRVVNETVMVGVRRSPVAPVVAAGGSRAEYIGGAGAVDLYLDGIAQEVVLADSVTIGLLADVDTERIGAGKIAAQTVI